MTHKGGRLLSTLVCFLFSYLTLTVLFSYIRGLFVYCPFLLGRFIQGQWLFVENEAAFWYNLCV